MYSELRQYISSLNPDGISASRRQILQPFAAQLHEKLSSEGRENVNLNFICTHNSRRSVLAQVWAKTISTYYGIEKIQCYSGGTEVTAVFPEIISTFQRVGFNVKKAHDTMNPVYHISYGDDYPSIVAFSKRWDDEVNPSKNFTAIMTCAHADENCPLILGAEARIPLTYEDPKEYDGSSMMEEKYEERSRQIASEMAYVFGEVASLSE
ncbi:MAG: protein-tyrosine-phosphatase [Salibacteraceae bacterium]